MRLSWTSDRRVFGRVAMTLFVVPAILLVSAVASAQGDSDFKAKPMTQELMDQLRKGGFVIYMRHGPTDTARPDRAPQVDLNDCNTQRPLTDYGRRLAERLGQMVRNAGIPVNEVVSSPMCRARESAEAAFGKNFTVVTNLMYSGNMTTAEKQGAQAATRELLARPVNPGQNRFVVGHAPNLADIMGYFIRPEGTMAVFRPKGLQGFEYLASVTPEEWARFK